MQGEGWPTLILKSGHFSERRRGALGWDHVQFDTLLRRDNDSFTAFLGTRNQLEWLIVSRHAERTTGGEGVSVGWQSKQQV